MSKLLSVMVAFCFSSSAFALSEATIISEIIRQTVDSSKFQAEVAKNNFKESDLVSVIFKPVAEINKINGVYAVYKSGERECEVNIGVIAALLEEKVVIAQLFKADSKCK